MAGALPQDLRRRHAQEHHHRALRQRARFSGRITAPPPVASTMLDSRVGASRVWVSRLRRPRSAPSISKIVGILTPCEPRSRGRRRRNAGRAAWRDPPTVVLPEPGMPTRTTNFASLTAPGPGRLVYLGKSVDLNVGVYGLTTGAGEFSPGSTHRYFSAAISLKYQVVLCTTQSGRAARNPAGSKTPRHHQPS